MSGVMPHLFLRSSVLCDHQITFARGILPPIGWLSRGALEMVMAEIIADKGKPPISRRLAVCPAIQMPESGQHVGCCIRPQRCGANHVQALSRNCLQN
jgi:hypothetical protein